ncbi:LAQU0S03e07910g1_1 [Lachancea quebecensis]|uniref:DNA replication complex GINS protein SLD5 n=1 Tax=Lachancea quebecensis TaxID=1654605 RepID=A0A0N7ML96_9SACH|nr:LAQU0S03e07910g1_1 [Lachancea quebecensis]
MNIDIEDILADLDRDTTAVDQTLTSQGQNDTTVFGSDAPGSDKAGGTAVSPVRDFEALMTHWRNERLGPELLPYPHALMARMLRRVQEQLEHIECISMGYLETLGEEDDHGTSDGGSSSNVLNKLPLLCMEADLERLKFVLRSYVRCRLAKVDKYSLYLRQLAQDNERVVPLSDLLSRQELEYHERHSAILLKLLNSTILRHMPPELQAVDDNEGSVKMVEEPEWDRFVFVYVRGPTSPRDPDPALEVGPDGQCFYNVMIQELREEVELTVGSIYVMRYNVVRELILEGKVELI